MASCALCTATIRSSDSPIEDFSKNRFDTVECRNLHYQRNVHKIDCGKGSAGGSCNICTVTMDSHNSPIKTPDNVRVCSSFCLEVYVKRNLWKIPY